MIDLKCKDTELKIVDFKDIKPGDTFIREDIYINFTRDIALHNIYIRVVKTSEHINAVALNGAVNFFKNDVRCVLINIECIWKLQSSN